jgi:riboflavin kinase / FMN adenylyltransferase
MNVYYSIDEIDHDPNTVITVGTFDGVHRGHRKILDKLIEYSQKKQCRDLVVTLDPHPQIVLQRDGVKPLRLLTVIEERLELFRQYGIGNVFVLPFTKEFAKTTPEEFIKNILVNKIGMKKIYIGFDHNFGKDRGGDAELLKKLSSELNFEQERVDPLSERSIVFSSTKIRNALYDGNLERANDMLGYYYFAKGKVSEGAKRGRQLGYPTANIYIMDINKLLPETGVYLVGSEVDGQKHYGMANLGIRPTFTDDKVPTLEVHFFDFDKDIYGKDLSIHFLKYIRPEMRFVKINNLTDQIAKDEIKCRDMIKDFSF